MSIPEVFSLVGFFLGVALQVFLLAVVIRREPRGRLEQFLVLLVVELLVWNGGNLAAVLLRQMDLSRVALPIQVIDSLSYAALSLLPATLLHTHWIYYIRHYPAQKGISLILKGLLPLLYATPLLLAAALPHLLRDPGVNPIEKLGPFRLAFLIVLSAAYFGSVVLQLRIIRRSRNPIEVRLFRSLIILFLAIPLFSLIAFEANLPPGDYLEVLRQLALLAAVFPSALVAYYIYRYRFLQITVQRSLASAFLILLIIVIYLAGFRSLILYLGAGDSSPGLLLEAVFLIGVLLLFPYLSEWLQNWVSRGFADEIARYQAVAGRIRKESSEILTAGEMRRLIEEILTTEFPAGRPTLERAEQRPREGWVPLRSGDHSLGWLAFSYSAARSPGSRQGARLLASEIVSALERSRSAERQLQLERRLAHKSHLEDLGRMAATIAHHVKNPLSSMKMLVQLLGEAENLMPQQREETGMIVREIDRLSQTVANLLRFARLEGSQPGQIEEVDLAQLIDKTVVLFRGSCQEKNLEMVRRPAEAGPVLRTDPTAVSEILSNLVSNAVDASPQGGRIEVEIQEDLPARQVRIIVSDGGDGIPPQVRRQLFQSFVTSKAQGTGLGLAISRRRARQLGGDLDIITSPEIRGTRAIVTLSLDMAQPPLEGP